jgi:hypothetical protein
MGNPPTPSSATNCMGLAMNDTPLDEKNTSGHSGEIKTIIKYNLTKSMIEGKESPLSAAKTAIFRYTSKNTHTQTPPPAFPCRIALPGPLKSCDR